MLITLILGALVGIVLGLSGAGGGILAVPALIAGMGWSVQQATPVALIAVAGSAAVGAMEGLHRQRVRYRAAIVMALAGVPSSPIGLALARHVPQRALIGLFALVMLGAALRLMQRPHAATEKTPAQSVAPLDPVNGRFMWACPGTWMLLIGIGATSGLVTGLLGVGGGFIIVPLLRRFTGLSMHATIATSLLVIALISSSAVICAQLHGTALPQPITLWFTAATAAGMVVGRMGVARVSERRVQQGFALLLLVVAMSLLVKALH